MLRYKQFVTIAGVKKIRIRVKLHRPTLPVYLRPEVLILCACLCYFTYTKVVFYAPLLYQQNLPLGPLRLAAISFDRFFTENNFEVEPWAIPINDFQRQNGTCVRSNPGGSEARGAPAKFGVALELDRSPAAPPTAYVCQQEQVDKFFIELTPGVNVQVVRVPAHHLGIQLESGELQLKGLANASVDILLPNGPLTLSSEQGFTATVTRTDDELRVVVKEGEAAAVADFAPNFREPIPAVFLAAAENGKFRVPERDAPLKAGRAVKVVPSGVYDEAL